MAISINTVRKILDTLYCKYDLEYSYCCLVGKSTRRPSNALKVYRWTANGTRSEWKTAREIVDLLGPIAERRNTQQTFK